MDDRAETIDDLLAQAEGPRLAFFRERLKLDDLAETLVAMANAYGGAIVLGASGRARVKIEGLRNVDAARETALEASLACTPPLVLPLPQELRHGEATLLLVTVPPGLPHVYSLHGKYVRRQGATNQPLTPDALRRLLADRGEVSWERLVPSDAAFAELDTAKINAYVRRLGPAAESDPLGFLYRRGCLLPQSASQGQNAADLNKTNARSNTGYIPNNAGLLLFGSDVERRFPQAEITLVQYRGRDLADEFERDDIRDTLPEAVRRADRWLVEHMRKGSRMVGLERQDWTQFPPAAVREALVNAVAHRDYSVRGEGIRIALFSDRLECYSPGRLPGHVTIENIVDERFSRNETLVQALADWGLIERLGYGIDRMIRQMEEAKLPPPEFRETAAGFLVVLQGQPFESTSSTSIDTREWVRMGLNERQIAALLFLTEQRRITNRDLQELAPDVSPETIRRDLADLVERGLLLKVGEKRATYYILK
ncbi:MAG: putative DNA binding domain-containing protein [Chloroflexales bacterium]|nr:putative DNA binding domain-containing protein [Chloroflexales bacterium]